MKTEECWNHEERIVCPKCKETHMATVVHSGLYWTYVSNCPHCGHIITESEWEKFEPGGPE